MRETRYKVNADVHFTIAVFSDLHNREGISTIESLKHNKPSMIAVPGDAVLGSRTCLAGLSEQRSLMEAQKYGLPFIRASVEIAPTYVSFGNHEWYISDRDIALLRSAGAIVLDNSWESVDVDGQKIIIGGLTSVYLDNYRLFRKNTGGSYPMPSSNEKPVIENPESEWLSEFEAQEGYKILLSHHPEYWSLREPYLSEHPHRSRSFWTRSRWTDQIF